MSKGADVDAHTRSVEANRANQLWDRHKLIRQYMNDDWKQYNIISKGIEGA